MDPIYVTGHRNPDTDAIVASIAYAELRNALGDRDFVPARLGQVNNETQRVLDMFEVDAPVLLNNVRTQVRDLEYDTPPIMDKTVTISMAWQKLKNTGSITVLPVVDEDKKLFGMLTSGDIANFTMKTIEDPNIYDVPVYNLLSVLEGQIVNRVTQIPDSVTGQVVVAVPTAREDMLFSDPNSIVIVGQQKDMVQRAIDIGAKIVVICQADVSPEFRELESDTCIITTPFDPYKVARLIHLAVPVERVCTQGNLKFFRIDDYIDDVSEVLLKSRFRAYPILDENDHVVGTMGRYHLIRPKRKKVVLVDHNEASQSVPGLSQAEVVAIIDHHRLGDIQTTNPIFVRNEPVGSTATIIASMYQERGLMPSRKIAGLLASAVISDTVMFKSPTCTELDKVIANRMAHIAGVTLDEISDRIFSSSTGEDKTAEELLYTDFKEFDISGHSVAIGQVTTLKSDIMLERKEEFLKSMKAKKEEAGYEMILIMVTDVLKEGTELLFVGDPDVINEAYGIEPNGNSIFMPGVMSRKKQIVPRITEYWS